MATEIIPTDLPSYLVTIPEWGGVEDLAERSIERAMSAETPEALLADPSSGGLRDHTGVPLRVTQVLGRMPSNLKGGGWYIVFEAVTTAGEVLTLTTGSIFAAPRIVKMHAMGWLPRWVKAIEVESTQNPGQSSLWVVDLTAAELQAAESNF